jgi:hypothetical protein
MAIINLLFANYTVLMQVILVIIQQENVKQHALQVLNKEIQKHVLKHVLKKIMQAIRSLEILFHIFVKNLVLVVLHIMPIIKQIGNASKHVHRHQCKAMDLTESVYTIALQQHGQTLFMSIEFVQLLVQI